MEELLYKIFIVGDDAELCMELASEIQSLNDDYDISPRFITDTYKEAGVIPQYEEFAQQQYYTLSEEIVEQSFKNNAFISSLTKEYITEGITYDDFCQYSIFVVSFKEWNMLSNKLFKKNKILTIWVDNMRNNRPQKYDITFHEELNYFQERILKHERQAKENNKELNSSARATHYPYLYFMNMNVREMANYTLKYVDPYTINSIKQEILAKFN